MDALTVTEERRREACENDILKGGDLIVVGLKTIRDERLYRNSHGTFEAYCNEKWNLSDRHVRRLIDHADVLANIAEMATGPIGYETKPDQFGPKLKEAATREIKDLPPEKQREVVKKVAAAGKKPTAKAFKEARQDLAPKPEPPPLPPAPIEPEPPADGKPDGLTRNRVIMQIRGACKEADAWTDEECRNDVRDELRKWGKRFDSEQPAKPNGKFVPPTEDEVREHIEAKGWSHLVDAEEFHSHYKMNGWRCGKGGIPMKDWHAAVVTWKKTKVKEVSNSKAAGIAARNRESFKQVFGS